MQSAGEDGDVAALGEARHEEDAGPIAFLQERDQCLLVGEIDVLAGRLATRAPYRAHAQETCEDPATKFFRKPEALGGGFRQRRAVAWWRKAPDHDA